MIIRMILVSADKSIVAIKVKMVLILVKEARQVTRNLIAKKIRKRVLNLSI